MAAIVALYLGGGAVVAYTSDAYVRSDLVALAADVAGPVKTVSVLNNQKVAAGDPIATIDPTPYQLDADLRQQQVARLEAAVAVKVQARVADAANLDAANAALRLAQEQFDRTKALTGNQYVSQADFDTAADRLRTAQDRVAVAQNQAQVDERAIDEARAEVQVARGELAVAQYSLSRTQLTAPVAGYINNLNLRPGSYARAGESASSTSRAGGSSPISRRMSPPRSRLANASGCGSTATRGISCRAASRASAGPSRASKRRSSCCPTWPRPPIG
jgi:membrane fusion protein, multidrug efflux system